MYVCIYTQHRHTAGNALGGGISLGDCAEGGYKCAQQALALLKSQ